MSRNLPAGAYLLNSAGSAGSGAAFDMRNGANYAMLSHQVPAASAIVQVQASHDGTAWGNVLTVTAVAGYGMAQISAYYPFVRAVASAVYSGGGNTGFARVFFSPGLP